MNPITFSPIGIIHTPFASPEGMPIQPAGARGVKGRVEVLPEFAEGLADLGGFSHVILIYHLHEVRGMALRVTPFLDKAVHGIFATRSPRRPNAIGLSVVRVTAVDGAGVDVEDVDMLDGSPLLDIKPFVPKFDVPPGEVRCGWLEQRAEAAREMKADGRFTSFPENSPTRSSR